MYGFSSVNRRAVATALTALLAASCARPPTQEMAEAERAIRAAVEAGAADFAPAEFTAAENRWADAKALLESQDFTRAQIAALEAKMKAEEARQAADRYRVDLRAQAEGLLMRLRPEIERGMEKAADVTGRAAEKIHHDALRLGQLLKEVENDFAEGRYVEVIRKSSEGLTEAGRLHTAIAAVSPPERSRRF